MATVLIVDDEGELTRQGGGRSRRLDLCLLAQRSAICMPPLRDCPQEANRQTSCEAKDVGCSSP